MGTRKKIALLNMRYDNNYGGNLQRYALVTVLRHWGYEVDYLFIRDNWDDWFENRSTGKIIKQSIKQVVRHLLHPNVEPWFVWHVENKDYRDSCRITEPFLNKYIPHTKPIYSHRELERVFAHGNYDAVVAGSDQIWRKQFVERYGLGTWYLDFVPSVYRGKRVIYGASFGVDSTEYSDKEIELVKTLYGRLDAVSVREKSGKRLLKEYYGCDIQQAEVVLDPTLLLTKKDYEFVIRNADTLSSEGDMFCYVLDITPEIEEKVRIIAKKKNLTPNIMGVNGNQVPIEQWLRYIKEAEFVFTDSYHGLLFSLIFNKQFHLEYNSFRGNARFDSIIELLDIDLEKPDYDKINQRIEFYRSKSLDFLSGSLSTL